MTDKQILDLLKYGERITLECKKAEGGIPNSLWETYSSFANTSGGVILLGVEEHLKETELEKRYTFCNLSNPQKMIKSFWDTINSKKVSANLLLDDNVGVCRINGCNVIWIEVPQADYRYRPVYLNENPLKGSYKRNYEGDYHCTEGEVKAMMRDASDFGIDGSLLEGFTMDDIDVNTLKAYRMEYELHNPEHIWNGADDKDFLRNLGGYTVDRITKREGLTVAGLLMFGKGLAIRERFDNIRMDYIDQTNLAGESRWSDRLTYDGSWENNLYNFVKKVLPKLVSDIKRPFRLEGMTRQDDTAVHKAVREAIVNMVIHADYYSAGILKVIKQENGFFFSNPGNLKLPVHAIYEGGHSVARNPKIQNMFRMIGLGDNIGSGFPAILKAWGMEKWRQPDLYYDQELQHVELKLWTISLMPEECTEFLLKKFGINYQHLSSKKQIILATAYLEGKVSNARIQTVLEEQPADVSEYLYQLVENRMLIHEKKGRWTTYHLNDEYIIQPEQMTIQDMLETEIILNETDQKIYNFVRANGMITAQQVVEITDITTLQGASVALNRMIKKGLLRKQRKGRHIFYL